MANAPEIAVEKRTVRRLRVVVRGAVQGVGFRPFVFRLAADLDLHGWVLNSSEGVFIEVDGAEATLREFLRRLEADKPAISHIHALEATYLDPAGFTKFEIRESSGGEKRTLILPDLATCPDCLADIADQQNRRYRYPFTNCTNCGPRFTIIESLPYDRPRTTMKAFVMCPECEAEYRDPRNRRFHAQPNACPTCGPQLAWLAREGRALAERHDALLAAAAAIREGQVVAIKGLGGFHLMVDARNEAAVRELRRRKRRDEKPLALMFPAITTVLEHCTVSDVEMRLLRSPESPIVLLPKRQEENGLASSIAPGNPYLGVMLPYTPLHHLLMRELGFPVVATSGNLSDEPICIDNEEALRRLGNIADAFLVHNRPILRHVDDSIVREMAGRELVIRRARGFAPLPVYVKETLPSIVAAGAQQKSTIAASVGQQVFISQHIGDLETAESLAAYERVTTAFRTLYELQPVQVACDMHPDYLSTKLAQQAAEPKLPVQHHYAHALACMAENQLAPPVLALSWDGSGYGPDHTVWGGECLRITETGYDRVAHLRTFALPGGEKAVKEPRRVALALLYEMYGGAAFELDLPPVRAFSPEELRVIRTMLSRGVNSPRTSSMGRLFDAVAALLDIRQCCGFEGQAAMELEAQATPANTTEAYPFTLDDAGVIDWAPMIAVLLERKEPVVEAARKFHNMLAAIAVAVARRAGERKVVLTGGCFQNRVLTETVIHHLQAADLQAYWHQRVPPNDGGIALGQVMAAARCAERKS